MGQWYLFKCPSCHYETECSDGPDRGMYAAVEPMICTDCKEVYNVAIGEFDRQGHYKLYEKNECRCIHYERMSLLYRIQRNAYERGYRISRQRYR